MHCFPLLRRRMVVQNPFETVRKSFSMASPNSSHVRVFASATAVAALRLACRYLPAASGVPQAKKFDGIPHRRCPPAGSGIAATQAPTTLRPQLRSAALTMEARNMAHLDSMSPAFPDSEGQVSQVFGHVYQPSRKWLWRIRP
ncbi:hypothetical protein N1851_001585 [Merluccius polli]|uniref:Uncharacterized protein n=1 Tax=Merluccius polli TaxID=89951 RepID=A0AA47PBI9_MERPO|nr:hypothetical protein N1851_001585 [Merluccius polli]